MRLPRDVSGRDLAAALSRVGYDLDHQTGSHIRLTTNRNGVHHVTIPAHDPLKVGALAAILRSVTDHLQITRGELLGILFE